MDFDWVRSKLSVALGDNHIEDNKQSCCTCICFAHTYNVNNRFAFSAALPLTALRQGFHALLPGGQFGYVFLITSVRAAQHQHEGPCMMVRMLALSWVCTISTTMGIVASFPSLVVHSFFYKANVRSALWQNDDYASTVVKIMIEFPLHFVSALNLPSPNFSPSTVSIFPFLF